MYPTSATYAPPRPRDTNRAYRDWADTLDLAPGVKATLSAIISYMYGAPTAWPSAGSLARRRSVNVRQIRKDTATLVRLGVIEKVPPAADGRRRQATMTYILKLPRNLFEQAYLSRSADVTADRSADVLRDRGGGVLEDTRSKG